LSPIAAEAERTGAEVMEVVDLPVLQEVVANKVAVLVVTAEEDKQFRLHL
jgi:hypothetical protein